MERTDIKEWNRISKERYENHRQCLKRYSSEGVTEKNNIFSFATKELSQDAFLAWCLNWYKDPDHKLHAMATDLLRYILDDKLDVKKINSLEVLRQQYHIDILIKIEADNERYALLIEDKTNSFEHGNQIEEYIKSLVKDGAYEQDHVFPVYCKTGFWFDYDYMVRCDTTLDAWSLHAILKNYMGKHPLVDDFLSYLETKFDMWKKTLMQLDDGDYAQAMTTHEGQYLLAREWFGERPTWTSSGSPELYWAELGTNFGSPWLKYTVWRKKYPKEYSENSEQMLFWRIDKYTDKGVSKWALSLKHYSVKAKDAAVVADAVRNRAYQHFCTQIEKRVQAELKKQSDCSVTYTEINRKRNSGEKTNERQVLTMYFDENPSLVQHIAQSITRCLKSHHFPNDHLEGEAE